jgi:hypothetical protein
MLEAELAKRMVSDYSTSAALDIFKDPTAVKNKSSKLPPRLDHEREHAKQVGLGSMPNA